MDVKSDEQAPFATCPECDSQIEMETHRGQRSQEGLTDVL